MKSTTIQPWRMSIIILLVLAVQSYSGKIHAQQTGQWGINPVMKVSNLRTNSENPMRLDVLNIDIKVIGQLAVTTFDMTYHNGNSRMMEGEFNFPLGEGQTVSRFALDINGALREGVVVEKEKGRKTFEAIVRRGVDPGLLEMTEGNNFRMRIYPLPANGSRRVVLTFEQELTNKGTYDLYLLPLKISECIRKFSIHAEVIKNTVQADPENNELSNLNFTKWNESYVATMEMQDFVPDKKLALSFPHSGNAEKVFTSPKNESTDSSYFYLNVIPKPLEKVKVLPKRITLIWDNSNSAKDRNLEKEIAVFDQYIHKIGNLTVELVTFNIRTGKAKTFEISNGNWDALKSVLKSMVYDGGTSMGCLDFTKFTSDEILLFSDGMSTYGKTEPTFSHTPVYTLNSSIISNHQFLTYIAQHSGGMYLDLNKFTNEEVLAKLTNSNYHFISAQVVNGRVSEVYPSMPCQFNNTFSMSGTMSGKSATLVLNFGIGTTITESKTIAIEADNMADPSILRRVWAEKKIAELSLNEDQNAFEITRTGKNFGIVTRNTSFIVLENLRDYLNNDIVPPKEMREQYYSQKTILENESKEKINHNIESVVALSNEQSTWWKKNFLQEPVVQPKKKLHSSIRFTAPVIKRDEEVTEDFKSQESLTVTSTAISIADVKGNDERGRDIADIKKSVTMSPGYIPDRKSVQKLSIQLNAWDPQTPYLKVLQYATAGTEYSTYLKLKDEYGSTPSFYMDAADFFSKGGKKDTAVTILSNLAELRIESPQLLRVLGNKLIDFKHPLEAVVVFDKVLKLKGEEPQSYRDLGLAYEASGDHEQSIRTLYEVVKKEWDTRFPGIGLIVMNEINSIVALHPGLETAFIDSRLLKSQPVNIRVVLTWDTDNCDMDLWVTDPRGEKCFYENKLTKLGGKISTDFTNGYGPEEYMIKKAVPGLYTVQANYYGTHSQALLAPVNLHVVFITNFGKPNEKKKEVTIRLNERQDVINVGKFSFLGN
jgi:hypothetical protein